MLSIGCKQMHNLKLIFILFQLLHLWEILLLLLVLLLPIKKIEAKLLLRVRSLAVLPVATLLVNVTNNAWFGDSAAPHQQMQMARFRALEAGRYLVRATSNGVSAIIAPDGRVTARAPQFVPDVLRGSARPYTGLTPYARTGNWPVLLLCALSLAAVLAAAALARRNRQAVGHQCRRGSSRKAFIAPWPTAAPKRLARRSATLSRGV